MAIEKMTHSAVMTRTAVVKQQQNFRSNPGEVVSAAINLTKRDISASQVHGPAM
jgi:hypothetical protein